MTTAFGDAVQRAATGDEDAWRALYDTLARPLLAYLRAQGASEPEDLLGETFCHLARGITTFDGDGDAFRRWAFLVAHHRVFDERRRRARRPSSAPFDTAHTPAEVGHEDAVVGGIGASGLRTLLERLPTAQRDAVLLRVVAGASLSETAAALGREVGAVKQLQRRGLLALGRLLASEGVTP